MPRFDSDTDALIERATLNASRTARDLEAWIFDQVRPKDGMRIADLGCGTGKQLFALAEALSGDTEMVGVDISEQAVSEVNARAARAGLTNVSAIQASLDACPQALPEGPYDLFLSTYAIYYAADVAGLLGRVASMLSPGGQMFLCGPGAGTNHEMVSLVRQLQEPGDDPVTDVPNFLDEHEIDALRNHYRSVSVSRMENTVTFTSPEETLTWWRNHNMYRPAADEAVRRELERLSVAQETFRLTKNVLGIHCRV